MESTGQLFVRALFLRLVGLVYFVAFVSLWVQVEGLIGSRGILPIADFLPFVSERLGDHAWLKFPTLCWLSSADAMLHGLCAGAVVLSCLLMIGYAPALCLVLLWAAYLSLFTAGRVFLSFQWDILLLETGFLAIWWAPFDLRTRLVWSGEPSRLVLWLLRWLLFRFMLSSGLVKLLSGDPTWRDLSALEHHYATQPLPAWTSWYVHQLPDFFHAVSVVGMFGIELIAPFTIFGPRSVRLVGAALLASLQIGIALTGNYGFFNLLTLVLCLTLLDDRLLKRIPRLSIVTPADAKPGWPRWLVAPIGVVLLTLSTMQMSYTLRLPLDWPTSLTIARYQLQPYCLTSGYGLFAVMTTTRPEIIVEGSMDGESWQPYEFEWKPGALDRSPGFLAPHMPRLDWQMWFAALRSYEQAGWVSNFLVRLLQGSSSVLGLMSDNPFPDKPPRYLRTRLFNYRFTSLSQRWESGNWWRREFIKEYGPVVSLRSL